MFRKPWSGYLKQNVLELIDGIYEIKEEHINENFIMTLKVELNPSSTFYEVLNSNYSRENSRISFFEIDNFPDRIILEKTKDSKLKFHIFEFKKNVANGKQIEKISFQFLAGYMHNKFIEPFIENNTESSFFYHVVYVKDNDGCVPNMLIPKIIPGEDPKEYLKNNGSKIKRFEELKNWNNNKIIYISESHGPEFNMEFNSINKIKLPRTGFKNVNSKTIDLFENIVGI